MSYSLLGLYAAAAFDGAIGGVLPNQPPFSIIPPIVVAAIFLVLLFAGPRLPRSVLGLFGPLGVILTAVAVATTPGAGDGAVLYALPVLWSSVFFGRRGAAVIIVCVAISHAVALMSLPAATGYAGRWVDVMVAVCAVAAVVLTLARRNQRLTARLVAEARTDPLTGLLNRRGFDERAALEMAHARRSDAPMALAAFDVDYFKSVNDEWGHETGDRVLIRIGKLLTSLSRDIDVVARLGGEEFAVLLPGTDDGGAQRFTQRVRETLASSEVPDLPAVRLSAGTVAPTKPMDIQTMLQSADTALYRAKQTGRDRTVAYEAVE